MKIYCPNCGSADIEIIETDIDNMGDNIYNCNCKECGYDDWYSYGAEGIE